MVQPIPIDPHDALLQAVHVAAGMVAYANEKISELDENELIGPTVTITRERADVTELNEETGELEDRAGTTSKIVSRTPALHAWIRIRDEELDRLVRYSKVCIDAGIAERHVTLAAGQAQMLATAVGRILTALGVGDHPDAPAVARRELERVSALHAA